MGFNGKENDNEVKGEGNQQDYGRRIYDPRLVRFLSVDPLQTDYPWYTPFQFAGNSPILNVDLDGLETCNYNLLMDEKTGKSKLVQTSVEHGSLFNALTVQKVNYNGGIYVIDAEWNYSPYHGFDNVKKLEGKTESELAEYFKNKKTESQQADEQRQKDEQRYKEAGAIVFGGNALNRQQSNASSPEKKANTQTTAANNGNKEAAKANTTTTTPPNITEANVVLRLNGKTPIQVESDLITSGWNKTMPQASTPSKIQHTVFSKTSKSGAVYTLDYHPGPSSSNNSTIHNAPYWKVYYQENSNAPKTLLGRIAPSGFINYDRIKEPLYIDGKKSNVKQ